MADRNLLPKHFLADFKVWLEQHGHETRTTTAEFQVLQVKLFGDPRWHAIYEKLTRNPHYTVTQPLVKITEQFIYEYRYANHHPAEGQQGPAAADSGTSSTGRSPEDCDPAQGHEGGADREEGSDPPWD